MNNLNFSITSLCLVDDAGEFVPTSLEKGDLIGLSKDGIISFSRGHFPINFSPESKTAIIEGVNPSDHEMLVSALKEEQNSKALFGVKVKERHRSPDNNIVYFMVE
jgi:hypothetical protein